MPYSEVSRDMDELAAPDGYTFTRRIGRGASSVVWEASRAASGGRVALKVLEADVSDADAVRQFERERQAMTALAQHPNILTIVDAGVQGGRPWLAMELCQRGSLAAYVADGGPLDLPAALRVLDRLAGALSVAHEAGVVHCDIKPANVMLTDAGEPTLGDFGIARVSVGRATTTTVGGFSLDHVAPELLDDGKRSPRSDVYSLGTTVWELLAGHPPFRRTADVSVGAVLTRILRQALPEVPGVPDDVLALLRRMAAKTPEERPASMGEVAAEIRELAGRRGIALHGAPLPAMTAVEAELGALPLAPVELALGGAPTHLREVSTPPPANQVLDATATHLRAGAAPLPAAGRRRRLGPARRPVVAAAVVAAAVVAVVGAAVIVYQTLGSRAPALAPVALQASAPPTTEVGAAPEPVAAVPSVPTAEPAVEAVAAPPVAPAPSQTGRPTVAPQPPPPVPPPITPVPTRPGPPPTTGSPPSKLSPIKPPPTTTPTVIGTPVLFGDLNRDGKVGCKDEAILQSQWNRSGSDLSGDLNEDGTVNLTDMSMLLSHWTGGDGGSC